MTEEETARSRELEQKQIEDGKRAKELMEDPFIRDLLAGIEKRYLTEFADADTDEKRRTVWAKSKALVEFAADLRGAHNSGVIAKHQRTTREAAEDRSRRANTRK